jgi:hypothetical protein
MGQRKDWKMFKNGSNEVALVRERDSGRRLVNKNNKRK